MTYKFSLNCSGGLEDVENKVIKDLSDCSSLTRLNAALTVFKYLIDEINQSKVFFHCESNCDKTRISLKLSDGTEFASLLIDDSMDTLSESEQHEILDALLELCEKAIDCIEKRIPVVKEINRVQVKKIVLDSTIFMTLGFLGVVFHTNIVDKIVEILNINGSDLSIFQFIMNHVLEILALIFLLKAGIIPLQYIFSDYIDTSTKNSSRSERDG